MTAEKPKNEITYTEPLPPKRTTEQQDGTTEGLPGKGNT